MGNNLNGVDNSIKLLIISVIYFLCVALTIIYHNHLNMVIILFCIMFSILFVIGKHIYIDYIKREK